MRIVVTGGDGFIARTLRLRLLESGYGEVTSLTRAASASDWHSAVAEADAVFHLAGVNRTSDERMFHKGNTELTSSLCRALEGAGRGALVVFSSSTQAERDNPYGQSKRAAERAVEEYSRRTGARGCILRLPNVFGKWARPNYNSAVATFCHNIARGLPITVHDPEASLILLHVDDAVDSMLALLPPSVATGIIAPTPAYRTTVGDVVAMIQRFAEGRRTHFVGRVGTGLERAMYATYLSYLPPEDFSYPLERHEDPRGAFSEMLRTPDSGQVSYFTAHPGVTRGEHYHHSKTEKFLVVQGQARFAFRHLVTGETCTIDVEGSNPRVVETSPGWIHKITNVGPNEMVVLLWANEVFDPRRPDTYPAKVVP